MWGGAGSADGAAPHPLERQDADAVPSAGTPVAVDGRAYDGDVSWQVAVRTAELPLSAGFDLVRQRLRAPAAEHSGQDGGWGTPPP